jgi:hypothetical protein
MYEPDIADSFLNTNFLLSHFTQLTVLFILCLVCYIYFYNRLDNADSFINKFSLSLNSHNYLPYLFPASFIIFIFVIIAAFRIY